MESLIYVNTENVTAHCTPTGNGPPRVICTLLAQWQARFSFFVTGEEPAAVTGITLRCVLKEHPTGAVLLASSTTSVSGAVYTFDFASVDSSGLRTLIGDADEIELEGEIEWTLSGRVERVYFPVTVLNSRHRPDDAAPDPADEAYEAWLSARAVRFDEAQTLTTEQKAQARTNIGASSSTGGSLPAGGTTGQVLAKESNTDGDADWQSLGGAAALNVGTTSGTVCAGDDSRLTNSRAPSGSAGGVLAGTYPNPTFATDMATQDELDTGLASKADLVGGKVPSTQINTGTTSGSVCAGDDLRLSNSRTPTTHTHPQSDITGLSDTLAAKADLVGGKVPSSQIPFPISISNGGTGSTTADAARLALGIEETTSATAQEISVFVQDNVLLSWAGNYIDIDNVSVVYRFWFSVNGTGTAPSTPSGGLLTEIALTSGTIAEDAALAIAAEINGYLATEYLSSGLFKVTNSNGGAASAPSSTFAEIEVSVSVPGENAGTRLAPADGSGLTDIIATTIPAPTALTLGGVIASEGGAGQFVKGLNTSGGLIYESLPTANTDVRLYTADATWTNPSPSTAKRVFVRLVGGGGGGGSGRKGLATTTARCGGGGGAAGAVVEFWALTTDLGTTESVTIGAGGTGGAAQTTNSTNGNNGTNGGDTTFAGVRAIGGNDGLGGTASAGTGGATTASSCVTGVALANNPAGAAAGANGAFGGTPAAPAFFAPTGGGGGGGLVAANTNTAGGAGGAIGTATTITALAGGTAGASGGGNGGNGNTGRGVGTGGGGGGSNNAGNGGAGGNGGGFGSGGGGGAAGTDDVGSSGSGGNGAQGYALIITY